MTICELTAPSPTTVRSSTPTLLAALLGFFVVTLDAVIVNVALPHIRNDLGGRIGGLQWVVDGYTLFFAALLLSAGSLTDRIGAKRAFGGGVVVFVVASAACGLAPNMVALVLARFVQGSAAAVIMPSSMALIGQAYRDPRRRARAVAIWAMGGAVASSAGPVLGGVLTLASWRWIFLVNVPVGALALLLLSLVDMSTHHRAPFDWAGQLTGVVAMAGLTFGAIEAGRTGLGSPTVLVAFGAAVVAVLAFLLAETRVGQPMLPLDLLRSRIVAAAVVVGFAFMVGYYGMPFVMSLFLQQQRGLSSLDAGVAFVPMMVTGLVLTTLVPRVVERVGVRAVVVTGLVLMVVGLGALGFVSSSAPVTGIAALMVLVGLGGPTVIPPMIAALLHAVPGHRAGTASGAFNTSRQLGGALAIAVFGALLSAPAGFEAGLRASLLVAAIVAAAAAVAAVVGLRHQT